MSPSRRVLQAGFLLAGLAAVVVVDSMAAQLARALGWDVVASLVLVGGRVLGGLAVGMALRLQLAPRARPDTRLRLALGLPCALLAVLPAILATWPTTVPVWALRLQGAAPFAGTVLGLTLALAVRPARR